MKQFAKLARVIGLLREHPAGALTALGVVLYAAASLVFLVLGQYNSDEGWYLYASRLAYQGLLPYRDFAYTQMPLLPYLYGALQAVIPGLVSGRLTSVLISLATLGMGIVIARRYGGPRAGALAALLYAAFTFGIYFNSIVKTYALVSFLFTATLFVLSSPVVTARSYALAVMLASAAVLVRITAILFAVPVLMLALFAVGRARARALFVGQALFAGLVAGLFVLPDWPAARWNLLDSHLSHWIGGGLLTQIYHVLAERLPDIAQNYGPLLLLLGVAGFFAWRDRATLLFAPRRLPLLIVSLGAGLFAASHLANGLWDVEYLVPAAIAVLPTLAVLLADVYERQNGETRVLFRGVIAAALLLCWLGESLYHVDLRGRRLPLAEIATVANYVAQHSQPDDQVLALEMLGALVDAHRSALPGITLAQFSVQTMDDATARRMHVVNTAMLADAVDRGEPAVVVLTEGDWGRLQLADPDSAELMRQALDREYELGLTIPQFGQFARPVSVYLNAPNKPAPGE